MSSPIDTEDSDIKSWLSKLPSSSSRDLNDFPELKASFEKGLEEAKAGKVRRRSFVNVEFEE